MSISESQRKAVAKYMKKPMMSLKLEYKKVKRKLSKPTPNARVRV